MAISAEPVEFRAGEDVLRGTIYIPPGEHPFPGVVLGHGWGMVAGGDLEDYARRIVAEGIVCLTFDYRRLGKSDGMPRQEIDPAWQQEDFRTAITYLGSRSEVDAERIGIWGTSYGGGHVLVVAATDHRVRCVVSQVPTISGYLSGLRKTSPQNLRKLHSVFAKDRLDRLNGQPPGTMREVGMDDAADIAYPGPDSFNYMNGQGKICPEWRNEVTIRSLELARAYEPGLWVPRIGPAALLMIVARDDQQTPTDMQLDAFTQAREPKQLLLLNGGHYTAYQEHFDETSTAAARWFSEHL
ncbi:alpha/beta hydrolase [Ochrobactrum sp. CM-21-5]|nr:alpha/beta fold hydrolase [Ochrobactrum sp. CM-21-5]MBC2887122.1 alpha/beta hydrolase [Ochrobactrum sp. CM-21-5]